MLIGLLFATPAVAAWLLRAPEVVAHSIRNQSVTNSLTAPMKEHPLQIPVDVIAKGSPPQTVYVEVSRSAVPEPSEVLLLGCASVLLLRRTREGK